MLPEIIRADCELVIVEEESLCNPDVTQFLCDSGARCLLLTHSRPEFHKTLLLNQALIFSRGEYVIPYDADLLPLFSINELCRLVKGSPLLVIGGYRIMSGHNDPNDKSSGIALPRPAPEDCSGALYKQIAHGEKFMVCPAFKRQELLEIGGWDERFIGWGCEDQDVLERYCRSTKLVCARSRDLLYLHFDHLAQSGWNEPQLVSANRAAYYSFRK